MRLSNLPERLSAYGGFVVVEHAGARRRGYKARDLTRLGGVVWHGTGTPNRPGQSDYPTANYIMTGGTYAPWSQIGIGRTGRVHHLASGLANHAGRGGWSGLSGNSDLIGVEVESANSGDVTPAQFATIRRLARALTVQYGIPASKHITHKDWAPGRKVDLVGLSGSTVRAWAATPIPDNPAPLEDDMVNVNEDHLDLLLRGAAAALEAADDAGKAKGGVGRLEGQMATNLRQNDAIGERVTELLARPVLDPAAFADAVAQRLQSLPQGTVRIDARDLKVVVVEALRERDQRAAG